MRTYAEHAAALSNIGLLNKASELGPGNALDAVRAELLRRKVPARHATPGQVTICHGKYAVVQAVHDWEPFTHPDSPVHDHMWATEVVTDRGSRWIGREPAEVNR